MLIVLRKQIKLSILMVFILTILISTNVFASSKYARISGADRYETSSKIALDGWTQSDYAVLASGEDYPDALCATPLAGKYNSPLLLTEKLSLTKVTKDTIEKLKVKNIFIIGGKAVISSSIENQLTTLGIKVTRLAGDTRYETAIKVAEQLGNVSQITVVTGEDYADALSIAPIAVIKKMPIILVGKSNIPIVVKEYISNNSISKTYVIGKGTSIIDEDGLPNVTEINGIDKYSRNIAIITAFKSSLNFSSIYLATGENFADALSGSVLAGINENPLVLVGSDIGNQKNLLQLVAPNAIIKVLGGTTVVPDSTIISIGNNTTATSTVLAPNGVNSHIISGNSVIVTWNAVPNASSYKVYYCNDGLNFKLASSENGTQAKLDLSSASLASPTYFVVTSIVNGEESSFSFPTSVPVISSTTPVVNSDIPIELKATLISNSLVNITWNPVSNAGLYDIYCSLDSVNYFNIGCSGLNQYSEKLSAISPLATTTKSPIYFKITAEINHVESEFSAVTSVTPIGTDVSNSAVNTLSDVYKISFVSNQLTKTGDTTAVFKYKILNKGDMDITKIIPASQIRGVASKSASITLDPLTGTGTITFNSYYDMDQSVIVTLVDTVSSVTGTSTLYK